MTLGDFVRRALNGMHIAFLMVAMVFAVPFVVMAALIVVAMPESSGRMLHTVYPSPDRKVSLIIDTDLEGGPTTSAMDHAYLAGETFSEAAGVGTYYGGSPSKDGWTDASTVNLCARGAARLDVLQPKVTVSMTGNDGVERVYRVTSHCPPDYAEGRGTPEGRP